MTNIFKKSKKFEELILMYKQMTENGYSRSNGEFIPSEKVYGDLEPLRHKSYLKKVFQKFNIKTVLDYGSGKGNWNKEIDGQENLKDFLKLDEIIQFEPSLNKNDKKRCDCSICFDVLEHIFISDIPYVIHDVFSYSKKLVVINVACYEASALLPNGENAHITVNEPEWWYEKIAEIIKFKINLKIICNCTIYKDGKLRVFPLQFNDKINNYI